MKKITWNVKHKCGATAFVHFFIFLCLSCGYSKSEMVSGVWTMISYTLGQVAWGIATAYYLPVVTYLVSKKYEGLNIIFWCYLYSKYIFSDCQKFFKDVSKLYHFISEEGRSLQVTAGIKVGSLKRSADCTEAEVETMMTPLWVQEIQKVNLNPSSNRAIFKWLS